jgi:hypothetical protein
MLEFKYIFYLSFKTMLLSIKKDISIKKKLSLT